MRIAILCNDRIALPALDYLVNARLVVAIGMPGRSSETQTIIAGRCRQSKIPFQLFSRHTFHENIAAWLHTHQPDVVLVKTFPYLVPAPVLAIPRHGFVNFHYAPLPAWRGANPLFWMLRNGEKEGGITVHEMNAEYDAGAILLEQAVPIAGNINFGIYYTQLAHIAVSLTRRLVDHLRSPSLQHKEQDHSKAKWYAHPKPADLFIDWHNMTANEILALVKACNPWNKGAATRWKGWVFGITYASIAGLTIDAEAGTVLSVDASNGFTIACRDGKMLVAEVVYCEEGFYPGYCMSAFGLQTNDRLL